MNFNENDLLREKTELLYLRILKLARAKVLLKLEFDAEDQVLLLFFFHVLDHLDQFKAIKEPVKRGWAPRRPLNTYPP